MADDVTLTRRRKLLAHLASGGGTMALAELHDWSALKLLAAHQAFSQLMEGLVDDGMVRWDGGVFTITPEGRAEAELAPKRGSRKKDASPASPEAPASPASPEAPASPASPEAPASPASLEAPASPGAVPPSTPSTAAAARGSDPLGAAPSPASADAPLPHVDPPRVALVRRALRRLGRLIDRR